MRNTALAFAVLLLTTLSAFGQKTTPCHNDGPDRANCGGSMLAASGATTSPIEPRMETDSRFVINAGDGLDTGCTFRPDGPLVITLPITRVVGETNSDGTLKFPQVLVDNGLISPVVTVRMPAFDVDLEGAPGLPPEIDDVLINGQSIGELSGSNNTWKLNEFTIPVALVRFAQKNSGGGAPTPGNNVITILIDQASGSEVNWCTAIDWVEMSFTAMYPVVLVHGNNSCPGFYSGDLDCDGTPEEAPAQYFTLPFTQQKVLVDTSIHLDPDLIEPNGDRLVPKLIAIAASFGVKHLHVVAHSKGGLHMRHAITQIPTEGGSLALLSFITLSTPHLGSAGADYQLDAAAGGKLVGLFSDQPKLAALSRFVPPNPGTPDLRVSEVRKFNEKNLPLLKDYFLVDGEYNVFYRWTIGADGNLDDSSDQSKLPEYVPTIQQIETFGLPPSTNFPGRVTLLEMVYRMLGRVKETRLERRTVAGVTGWGIREILPPAPAPFELNDFAVTVASAHGMPDIAPRPATFPTFERANHATISNSNLGLRVLEAIKPLQPIRQQ